MDKNKVPDPVLKPTVATESVPQVSVEKITPPQEYSSAKGGILVVVDQNEVTIDIAGLIAEDIGCYRRCKMIRVKFTQDQAPQITPIGLT
ncbi:MAG: hypothetical protein CMB80_00785 [Flammeovirgaceae bacterium]|nr:hypothetical protein [Flammeovirgaceae bacterium]|tara:strand:+ start:509 stop:778 length:270 start_codon:yes stop_codon:yes gene_type:complete